MVDFARRRLSPHRTASRRQFPERVCGWVVAVRLLLGVGACWPAAAMATEDSSSCAVLPPLAARLRVAIDCHAEIGGNDDAIVAPLVGGGGLNFSGRISAIRGSRAK